MSLSITCALACSDEGGLEGDDEIGDAETSSDTGESSEAVVVEIALGSRHSCARLESGLVQCWGADGAGALGNGEPFEDRAYPSTVVGLEGEITAISAGGGHSCALSSTGVMSCWGLDILGELGDGDGRLDRAAPIQVDALGSSVAAIDAGTTSTCAIDKDGSLWCWGGDWFDQVGDGEDFVNPDTPVALTGQSGPAVAVQAEQRSSCALLESGEVQCWGQCWFGTLGIGKLESDDCSTLYTPGEPAQLSGPAKAIAMGDFHACALLESGGVQCWGTNDHGQLGQSNFDGSGVPIDVALPETATQVASGADFSCALLESGEVDCWGYNLDGQLGRGELGGDQPTPAAVVGLPGPATAIAVGSWHACAIIEGGELWCWGADHRGQLGDGPPFDRSAVPSKVEGLGEALEGTVTGPGIDVCDDLPIHAPGPAVLGEQAPHWVSVDQDGEAFHLCTLGGDKPIFLDASAAWCDPCKSIAEWISTNEGRNTLAPWAVLRDQLEAGELSWVTVLFNGPSSDTAVSIADAHNWHEAFPSELVVVAIDPEFDIYPAGFSSGGLPSFAAIDEYFRWYDTAALARGGDRFGP
ncbi:hypothetical protein G6O69_36505 [Pseudenhygromyxa sp. WMMC2535]|nr:hypothetical protein [Pseudenhygromyxa sp. WMMC2535]